MAIYRPTRGRRRALIWSAAGGLIVGGIGGFLVASTSQADTSEAARSIRSSLMRASGALEIVDIEYAEAVEDGAVVARAEYEGARDAAAEARAIFDDVRGPLQILAPDTASELSRNFTDLTDAVEATADENEIDAIVSSTRDLLNDFGGP